MAVAKQVRVMLVMPPAFGEVGGIAQYCRDLVSSIAGDSRYGALDCCCPGGWVVGSEAAVLCVEIDKRRPLVAGCRLSRAVCGRVNIVLCAHRDLLPLAAVLGRLTGAKVALIVYGIEVWKPPGRLIQRLAQGADMVISISLCTRDRMNMWAHLPSERYRLLPCGIDLGRFAHRTASSHASPQIMLTIARLDSRERYKGIDEVLGICPRLFSAFPDLQYRIIGDGDDRRRLEAKASGLGIVQRVKFIGRVTEERKIRELQSANAFVMPGCGEGFGIVYLEAMACGVPVVASCLDGSREAVLDGRIGFIANPNDTEQLFQTVSRALRTPNQVPDDLVHFSTPRFQKRLFSIINDLREAVK